MSEIPPPDERYERYDRDPRDPPPKRTNGWMVATVAIVALAVGVGAGLLIENGDDGQTRTVRGTARTVVETVTSPTTTSLGVTVTQPERTVERTVTADPVTVTVPAETAPEP